MGKIKGRRRKMTDSPALLSQALAMKKGDVLILKGVGQPRYQTLSLKEMEKLGVDESYQRVRITDQVNMLTHVLLQGGDIPDPVSIAERKDGSWWIVDGQQRFWAYLEAAKPMKSAIYSVADMEAERGLFVALNNTRMVRSEFIVGAWPGPSGSILRKADESPFHPFYQKLSFGRGRSGSARSSIVVKALQTVLLGTSSFAKIQLTLAQVDKALEKPEGKAAADAFLLLLGYCHEYNGNGHLLLLQALAIAKVARERWEKRGRPYVTDQTIIKHVGRIDYMAITMGAHALKWLPNVVEKVREQWPD